MGGMIRSCCPGPGELRAPAGLSPLWGRLRGPGRALPPGWSQPRLLLLPQQPGVWGLETPVPLFTLLLFSSP